MNDKQEWKPCPPGTLHDVQGKQKQRDQAPVMARRVALGVLFSAGATAGLVFSQSGSETRKISCAVAMQMAPDYIAGVLDNDDSVLLESHLEHCPMCDHKVNRMQQTLNA